MKITKVILDDGTFREVGEIKPLSYFEEKYPENNNWFWLRRYENQFNDFEDDIIELLSKDNIEEYAKDYLDLVDENDVEEKDISDFTDAKLLEEIKDRKLNLATNIISSSFLDRFENIVGAENVILLDNILTELENKLKINI